jgi:hypothetical protein
MKPKLFIITLLTLLVAGCTREPIPQLEEQGGKLVTISATIRRRPASYMMTPTAASHGRAATKSSWQDMMQAMLTQENPLLLGQKPAMSLPEQRYRVPQPTRHIIPEIS